jgi:hypothetical protein
VRGHAWRWSCALLVMGALAGGAGCAPDVLLTIHLPEGGVTYDGLQLTKLQGAQRLDSTEYFFQPARMAGPDGHHTVEIRMPRDVPVLNLRAELHEGDFQIAWGEVDLKQGQARGELWLLRCFAKIDRTLQTLCARNQPPPEPIPEPSPDAGRDADGGDERPETAPEVPIEAVACREVDVNATPVITPPANPSEGCVTYCQAMQASCDRVYFTIPRCLYACTALGLLEVSFDQNELRCRRNWATTKGRTQVEQEQNCSYAALDSAACGPACNVYCHMGAKICPDFFPAESKCREDCQQLERRLQADTPGSDVHTQLFCRMGRLHGAILNRDLCTWGAPNNSCGDCPPLSLH